MSYLQISKDEFTKFYLHITCGHGHATPTSSSLAPENPEWFTFPVPAYSGCPGEKAVKQM